MHEIKAYHCDYCKKYYKHKSSAIRHENGCFYNPQNKACLSCKNFITDYTTVYVRPRGDQNYGDADYEQRYNYCEYTGKSFQNYDGDRQEFKKNCRGWKPKEKSNER